jgi:hypothetical protein
MPLGVGPVRLELSLRERIAALAARREERDKRFLALRRQYVNQLRDYALETKESQVALDTLREEAQAAAEKAAKIKTQLATASADSSASGKDQDRAILAAQRRLRRHRPGAALYGAGASGLPEEIHAALRMASAAQAVYRQNAQLRARLARLTQRASGNDAAEEDEATDALADDESAPGMGQGKGQLTEGVSLLPADGALGSVHAVAGVQSVLTPAKKPKRARIAAGDGSDDSEDKSSDKEESMDESESESSGGSEGEGPAAPKAKLSEGQKLFSVNPYKLRFRTRARRSAREAVRTGKDTLLALGDLVSTPYGRGVVLRQRERAGLVEVRMQWGAVAILQPICVALLAVAGEVYTGSTRHDPMLQGYGGVPLVPSGVPSAFHPEPRPSADEIIFGKPLRPAKRTGAATAVTSARAGGDVDMKDESAAAAGGSVPAVVPASATVKNHILAGSSLLDGVGRAQEYNEELNEEREAGDRAAKKIRSRAGIPLTSCRTCVFRTSVGAAGPPRGVPLRIDPARGTTGSGFVTATVDGVGDAQFMTTASSAVQAFAAAAGAFQVRALGGGVGPAAGSVGFAGLLSELSPAVAGRRPVGLASKIALPAVGNMPATALSFQQESVDAGTGATGVSSSASGGANGVAASTLSAHPMGSAATAAAASQVQAITGVRSRSGSATDSFLAGSAGATAGAEVPPVASLAASAVGSTAPAGPAPDLLDLSQPIQVTSATAAASLLQRYRAELQRVTYQLRTAEEARADQRRRLTEDRITTTRLLQQLQEVRADLAKVEDEVTKRDNALLALRETARRLLLHARTKSAAAAAAINGITNAAVASSLDSNELIALTDAIRTHTEDWSALYDDRLKEIFAASASVPLPPASILGRGAGATVAASGVSGVVGADEEEVGPSVSKKAKTAGRRGRPPLRRAPAPEREAEEEGNAYLGAEEEMGGEGDSSSSGEDLSGSSSDEDGDRMASAGRGASRRSGAGGGAGGSSRRGGRGVSDGRAGASGLGAEGGSGPAKRARRSGEEGDDSSSVSGSDEDMMGEGDNAEGRDDDSASRSSSSRFSESRSRSGSISGSDEEEGERDDGLSDSDSRVGGPGDAEEAIIGMGATGDIGAEALQALFQDSTVMQDIAAAEAASAAPVDEGSKRRGGAGRLAGVKRGRDNLAPSAAASTPKDADEPLSETGEQSIDNANDEADAASRASSQHRLTGREMAMASRRQTSSPASASQGGAGVGDKGRHVVLSYRSGSIGSADVEESKSSKKVTVLPSRASRRLGVPASKSE